MKKKNKILLASLISISAISTVAIPVVLTSCSSNTNKDSAGNFNTEEFIKNENKKYLDLANTKIKDSQANFDTVDFTKRLLATDAGQKQILNTAANEIICDWFSKINNPLLKNFYDDELQRVKDALEASKKTYSNMNLYQRDILDPKGGTENSFIYSELAPKLMSKLADLIFAKNYLCIKTNQTVIKPNDPSFRDEIDKDTNINGAKGDGTRNNFVFDAKAVDNDVPYDAYYADFVSFIFDEWSAETIPLITPSLLYKNQSTGSAKSSGLFNPDFFKTSLDTTGSSYKFQFYDAANKDYTTPNAEMKYKLFIDQLKTNNPANSIKINANTGAITALPILTDDSSVNLISNAKTTYNEYVTPYAAAGMYKFNTALFGQSQSVPSISDFQPTIMQNFISKSNSDPGEFAFPYTTNNNFLGAYAGIQGITDTKDITNTPWIITRDEFGVHVIGIDRFSKIKAAATAGTDNKDKFNKAINEVRNTLLYRIAKKQIASSDDTNVISLDLQTTLKTYFTDNASRLIFKYLKQANKPSPNTNVDNNLFSNKNTLSDNKSLLTLTPEMSKYLDAILKVVSFQDAIKYIDTITEKVYSLQTAYGSNKKPSELNTFGMAGALPYARNNKTGEFDDLSQLIFKMFNVTDKPGLLTAYKTAKTELVTAIDGLNLQPANTTNYFDKPEIGKQEGISQYIYVNNFLVNQLLIQESTTTSLLDLYNMTWDNTFTKVLKEKLKTPTAADGWNKWTEDGLKVAIKNNYFIKKYITEPSIKSKLNVDWSNLSSVQTTANNLYTAQNDLNTVDAAKNYMTTIKSNDDLATFLKTLSWLLDYDETNGQYKYTNLIKVLNEIVDNEKLSVGYIGWNAQSNSFANPNFGTTQADDFKYKNPIYITNINAYSYLGAANPTIDATSCYFGENTDTYFYSANTDASNTYQGYLGFQNSSSSLTTATLPSKLFTGELLKNQPNNNNYKGIFYKYDTGTHLPADAKANLIKTFEQATNAQDLVNVANDISNIGFGILNNTITVNQNQTITVNQALKSVISGTDKNNNTISFESRKEYLKTIVNVIPDIAFEQIKNENLYNIDSGTISNVFYGDKATGNVNEYLVTQFNKADIKQFEDALKANKDPSYKFASAIDDSAFFTGIVLLAQNSEIQSRATISWSKIQKSEKIIVYYYNLAIKLGENVVKNWKDFV